MKYHINRKGEKAVCRATKRPCQFTPVEAGASGAPDEGQPTTKTTASVPAANKPKVSPEQLEAGISEHLRGWDNMGHIPHEGRTLNIDGTDHTIKFVSQEGGYEEGPEHVEIIFTVDGELWRKEGRYSSYGGADGTDYEYGNLGRVRENFRYETKYYSDESQFTSNPPLAGAIEISGPGWENLYPNSKRTIVHDGNTYKVEVIDTIGGEGEGSEAAVILKVNGETWRKQGHYSSYDGHDYSFGLLEKVEAHQDYVTFYEDIDD